MKNFSRKNKFGVPVVFYGDLRGEGDDSKGNLYRMKLCHVIAKGDGIVYKPVNHVFTAKELSRAAARYYSECENLGPEPYSKSSDADVSRGYVGLKTYMNRNSVLTTRFIFRFDGRGIDGLGDSVCVGMFTAREMRRSVDRVGWFKFTRFGIFRKLWAFLFPPSHDD